MSNLGTTFYFNWEIGLMAAIQEHFGKFGILISQFLSLLGQEYPLVLIVVVLYFAVDKKLGERICISLMTALIWVPMVKNIFFRRRPYWDHENVDILIAPVPTADPYDIAAQGFSFPSAHSACAAAAYPSLGHASKKKWLEIIAYVLVFAIGISRFCVGAHYPTDVLAGWFIGIFVSVLVALLYKKCNSDLANFILLLTGIPGLFYCQTEDFFSGFGLLLGACFGFWFEKKYVNFKKVKGWKYIILRIICALAVFLLFGQGLKFIFGESLLVRVIRYAIGAFLTLGVYPLVFNKFEKETK